MSAPNEYNDSHIEQQLSYLINGSGVLPEPESRIGQQIDHIIKNGTATEREMRADVEQIKSDVSTMKSIGRYLSVWDCTTGLPQTNPTTMPYAYQTGDYYRIGVVGDEGGTNYMPDGSSYTGQASTTVDEDSETKVNDIYIYDDNVWKPMHSAVLLDAVPIEGSTNAVTSGGVFTALAPKYSPTNPPPYPVSSVNGQTGGVVLNFITFDEEEES